MIELFDIILATIFCTFCMLWWNAQGVKQYALNATKNYCKKMDVLLLDDSIALRGFWLKRNKQGRICLWRSYLFEFTATGDDRYQGRIILLGNYVETIQLEAHRFH